MAAPDSLAAVRRRYGWVASVYDWANLEGVLYADARATAVGLLDRVDRTVPRPFTWGWVSAAAGTKATACCPSWTRGGQSGA